MRDTLLSRATEGEMKPGHWVAIAVAAIGGLGLLAKGLIDSDTQRDVTATQEAGDSERLSTQIQGASNLQGTVIAATATREAWLTEAAPPPTRIPPSPTSAPMPTPIPGPISALHAHEQNIPLCTKGRSLNNDELPCWYILTEGTPWENIAYEVYDIDVGTGATLIRNHNRDRDGRYMFPYLGYLTAVYVPKPSAFAQRLYAECASDPAHRRYPCVYEVVATDNKYRQIAVATYYNPDYEDALLDANQYYDTNKGEWFKVELKKGILLVMPRFQ
jgi:hypothetical protein